MIPVVDNKITISGFNGLYSRGMDDVCPQDHLTECYDCSFPGSNQVKTRDGFALSIELGVNCRQFYQSFIGLVPGRDFIVLDSIGKLWWGASGSLIKDFGGSCDGFASINLYDRVYICPTNNGAALSGDFLYVYYYNGAAMVFKKAGGAGYSATLIASHVQTTSGVVDAGVHQISFVMVTKSGFTTIPSPVYAVTAPGSKRIDLTLIAPIAETGIDVAYVLMLMSKADETELFFVPNGRLEVGESSAVINASDTDLVVSANYLYDQYVNPPAGAGLNFYKGRLIVAGPDGNDQSCLVSEVEDPESFSTTHGDLQVPQDSGGNTVRTAFNLRDSLYVSKFTGVYTFQDNGDVPSTWPMSVVEGGFGCYNNGLSSFTSGSPAIDAMDQSLIANKAGLFIFTGNFQVPPLTYKIEDLWARINVNHFDKVIVTHDLWNKQVYVAVPLDSEDSSNVILLMDYKEGMNYQSVKWSIWRPSKKPTWISMARLDVDQVYRLRLGSINTTKLLCFVTGAKVDYPTEAIISYVTLPPITLKPGWIICYNAIRMRIFGEGYCFIRLYGEDKAVFITPPGFDLSTTPGKEFLRQVNFTNEKVQLLLSAWGTGTPWFHLNKVEIFGIPRWITWPVTPT